MPNALAVTSGDLDTLARTIFGEARGEPLQGQQAVAWIVRNRVEHPGWWGRTVASVCLAPYQFSCWLESDPNREKMEALSTADPEYQILYEVGRSVMAGEVDDPTNGAVNYKVVGTPAKWAEGVEPSCIIGSQEFYCAV